MEMIDPRMFQDFQRWLVLLKLPVFPKRDDSLTVARVLKAHYLICDYFSDEGEVIATPGPKDEAGSMLISAVGRQHTSYSGVSKWKSPLERAATLFYGLIKNHPFYDGNKRTALLSLLYSMHKIGRTPTGPQEEFEELSVRTADDSLAIPHKLQSRKGRHDAAIEHLAKRIKSLTREVDKRHYLITFRQLDTILRRFDCSLENPRKNYIDVIYHEELRGLLGFRRRVERKLQIGFPGMKSEVGMKAIRSIRKAAHLNAENGIDSMVFFKGADPTHALISRFHAPLQRLKDK